MATPHISSPSPYGIGRRYNRRSPPYIPPLIRSTEFSGGLTAIKLTEDRCLENAMQWVDAFIFCDEDGAVSMESAKANGEKHIAVNGSKQDAVVNIQKAISIAKEALTWLCCDCFREKNPFFIREKNPFFIKEVSRTTDRMYWMVQVCWAEGEEMRLSKELTIESKTGEVVGVKSYDTI